MKPYPRNDLNMNIITPIYAKNTTADAESRYSIYRKITNLGFSALEIKLTNSISKNKTYKGYYYTTQNNETLYSIAKKYYNDETLWWVLAKANNLKNGEITVLDKNVTLLVPALVELTAAGGYFSVT